MARVYLLLFLAELALTIVALISCLSAEEGEVRALPRLLWVLIILLFPLVGSIVYLVAGRPEPAAARHPVWRPGGGLPEASRPPRQIAPDDDPEFLSALGRSSAKPDDDLLRRWEDDLKRREDDLRKREAQTDEPPPSDG